MKQVVRQAAQEHPKDTTRRGRGFTLIELIVLLAIVCLLVVILWPAFYPPKHRARPEKCLSHVKQISMALIMYTSDYDDECLPPHKDWVDTVYPYILNRGIFVCPRARRLFPGYAYNAAVAGRHFENLEEAAATIVIYDAKNGKPAHRHNDGLNCGFGDGHAMWLRELPARLVERDDPNPGLR